MEHTLKYMENVKIQSKVHKDFVQAAKSCVDCRPPKNAMHYAKRMRARKVHHELPTTQSIGSCFTCCHILQSFILPCRQHVRPCTLLLCSFSLGRIRRGCKPAGHGHLRVYAGVCGGRFRPGSVGVAVHEAALCYLGLRHSCFCPLLLAYQ